MDFLDNGMFVSSEIDQPLAEDITRLLLHDNTLHAHSALLRYVQEIQKASPPEKAYQQPQKTHTKELLIGALVLHLGPDELYDAL